MITHYLDEFVASSKHILLLQGPIGNFFYQFSNWLQSQDKHVFKINFNAGDAYFYPSSAQTVEYRDTLANFAEFLRVFCRQHHIDSIVCFGDNRPYHRMAKQIATQLGLTFWVFEEGYIRPNYITFEKSGVNAHSIIPRDTAFFYAQPELAEPKVKIAPMRSIVSFVRTAIRAIPYYFMANYRKSDYPYYQHHRELTRGYYTKAWAKALGQRALRWVCAKWMSMQIKQGKFGEFFAVPLQVHNDSQVLEHSDYKSVELFLREVLHSFAENAPKQTRLIIKHHPMDEHLNYQYVIDEFKAHYPDLIGRVFYVYRIGMPVLYRAGKGLVTLNSTCGLSAIKHGMPVKVLGRAHYNVPHLTDPHSLDEFWLHPTPPDEDLAEKFRRYHLNKTQINGSFYSKVVLDYPLVKHKSS